MRSPESGPSEALRLRPMGHLIGRLGAPEAVSGGPEVGFRPRTYQVPVPERAAEVRLHPQET